MANDILPKFTDVITRLPILNPDDSASCVVHESTAHKFLFISQQAAAPVQNPSLQDLLASRELGPLIQAIAFVGEDATLSDAQDAMNNKEKCQDVFVTRTGQSSETVLGWITNADIAKAVIT